MYEHSKKPPLECCQYMLKLYRKGLLGKFMLDALWMHLLCYLETKQI